MFNIFDVESIRSNYILARSYIKLVPAYELTKIIIDDSKKATILDEHTIINGILESNNLDLQLVLATYSTLDVWSPSKYILTLYEKGEEYRAALLGNSRIDWCNANTAILKDTGVSIIGKEICEKGNHLITVCRNPRMDRKLLSKAIRGLDQFSELSIDERTQIAYLTMDVKRVKSESYVGEDREDNEEQFDKPIEALLPFLKDIFQNDGRVTFHKIVETWLSKISNIQLEIDVHDWNDVEITIDAPKQKRQTSNDYFALENRAKWHAAFTQVVNFLSDTTKLIPDEFPKTQADYALAVFPTIVLNSLLRSYSAESNKIKEYLELLLEHPNWSIRAAYYAYVFGMTEITESAEMISSFLQKYELDKAEKWVGVTSTKLFQLVKKSLYGKEAINLAVAHSQYKSEIKQIDSEFLNYMYFINPNNDDYPKVFADYNTLQNLLRRELIEEFEREYISQSFGLQKYFDTAIIKSSENEEGSISKNFGQQRDVDATLAALDEYETKKSDHKTFLNRLFKIN